MVTVQDALLVLKNPWYLVPLASLITLCTFYMIENKKKRHVWRNTAITTFMILLVVLVLQQNAQIVLCDYGPATF